MKRSEALEEIRKILAMNGKDNGEGELEEAILHHLESLGMYPPDTTIQACPDPMFQVFIEHIDIPHWVVLGWDNEEK